MILCDECGLPISICNALAAYRSAIRHRDDSMADYAKIAEEEYARYLEDYRTEKGLR